MSIWDRLVNAVRTHDIATPKLKPAMLAQCILESGRGTSKLAQEHNNFTGLKYRPEMAGFATSVSYPAHDGLADYCAFASPEAFVPGYWQFISRKVYDGWKDHAEDPAAYIAFLKEKGYAGDPAYIEKVVLLLGEARRLLAETLAVATPAPPAPPPPGPPPAPLPPSAPAPAPAKPVVEPPRPSAPELVKELPELVTDLGEPVFETVPGVAHKWRGSRPKGLEGAIVHYDAGRTRPTKGPDNPELGARTCLTGAVANGFAYVTVSRSGKILLPGNMDWKKWGSHAGESLCPVTSRSSVSQYYVGFEVNSPGYVFPTADPDVFVPWFEAVRDANGNPVLDKKGHAQVKNAGGELYSAKQVRTFKVRDGNIKPGTYVPYTQQQMDALVNVMLWLKKHHPPFRLDLVFGHDEVAPSRKLDPGGCLGAPGSPGLTMADFRALLQKAWEKRKG